jgi:hypothetical protein
LTGTTRSLTNFSSGFIVDVHFSGFTTTPPEPPKTTLDPSAYIQNGGPVDPSTWVFYTEFHGTLTGFGIWDGLVLSITRRGPAFQVGIGANDKNVNFGMSGWFTWTVLSQPNSGRPVPTTGIGDFNLDCLPPPCPCPPCEIGYPFASANPLTSLVFSENEVLRGFSTNVAGPGDTIKAWYNDEEALTLGVRRVIVRTSSGRTTNDYPVSPLNSNPGGVLNPQVGTTALTGDQAGTDVSGRPMFPALFITDLENANIFAGDWQFGGTPIPPSAVFGTWKAAVRTVDARNSPPTVTVTPDSNPSKNNWNLNGGDPAPAGLANEGYGAEVRWNVDDLVNAGVLEMGHNYRLQFMVHDGDQTRTGGDVGQGCVILCLPPPPPAPRLLSFQSMPSGQRELKVDGLLSHPYLIEGSKDLITWKTITVITNTTGILQFRDSADPSRYFYRVKLMP